MLIGQWSLWNFRGDESGAYFCGTAWTGTPLLDFRKTAAEAGAEDDCYLKVLRPSVRVVSVYGHGGTVVYNLTSITLE
ncbi:hypothetical protein RvY_05863 [Ramazzottius varieornatus]|uniref:Uncharacterized protein n=1 Tax=Ramazzottius varieornatus TaxID=947166 RepID=A0A1D1V033_RAMVA|nr:hypothetical protein RvY_05863 [Ramazzottius varieornatus]